MKTELKLFEQFAPKEQAKRKDDGLVYAVSYTRVSSKEQFETNGSIESQEKIVFRLGEQMKVPVLAKFGGTYESAKSEERKEFQRMLSFIDKSKQNIRFILISDNDRFSRTGPNAIYLAEKLRAKGIQIIAASNPMDTSTSIGSFQQNIQFLFSHFDNQLRREKTIRGMMQKFEKGYYIGSLPIGYERQIVNDEKQIVINKTGEAIRKAFKWKAEAGLRTSEISSRLKKIGFTIPEKRLSEVFHNVFYCGLLSNKMLKGSIIEGKNWEPIVSKEMFLKANEVLKQYHTPHDYHKEDENVPLRRFVACTKCGTMWTGYIVKAKGLYYYKCNKKGCKCNLSSARMHEEFKKLLQGYEIAPKNIEPLKRQLELTFEQMNRSLFEHKKDIERRKTELKIKIDKAEERFIEGDIDRDSYQRYKLKMEEQLAEIAKDEQKLSIPLSNQKKFIDFSFEMCQNLSGLWASADLTNKQKLQKVIFPDGLAYDHPNHTYRTKRVNSVILQIAQLAQVSAENKKWNSSKIKENSARVAASRIELLSRV
ncbi:MAG: recombinase family protein [Chitinophagales bacterium]|nr:recombinase family protein [Chitinophagales bacterium]